MTYKALRFTLIPFIILLLGLPSFAQEYRDHHAINKRVENLVYQDIGRYMEDIVSLCNRFDVEIETVVGILYAEKVQYELDIFRYGKRELERHIDSFPIFLNDLYRWSQLTAGYTHIKEAFARETKQRLDETEDYSHFLSEEDIQPQHYITNPQKALAISIAGCAMLIEQWKHSADISEEPGILATLYNIGYRNSHPHPEPKTGGSTMPIIINGAIVTGLDFGQRVELLLEESEAFESFIQKHTHD